LLVAFWGVICEIVLNLIGCLFVFHKFDKEGPKPWPAPALPTFR
jgi:hypothetical protein